MILVKISLVISLIVLIMLYLLKNKFSKDYNFKGKNSTLFDKVQMILQILIPIYNILMLFAIVFMTDLIERRMVEKGLLEKKCAIESEGE